MPLERYGELNASLPGTETFHYAVGHNGADYGAYRALPVDMLVVGGGGGNLFFFRLMGLEEVASEVLLQFLLKMKKVTTLKWRGSGIK